MFFCNLKCWTNLLFLLLSTLFCANAFPTAKGSTKRELPVLKHYIRPRGRLIKAWTALGDSYSAGIGTGVRPDSDDSANCARFSQAYPRLMSIAIDGAGANNVAWQFGSCSGAVIDDVLEHELLDKDTSDKSSWWGAKNYRKFGAPQFVTLSISGNDVGFFNIVNNCVYRLIGSSIDSCEQALRAAESILANDNTYLDRKLDEVLAGVIHKGQDMGGAEEINGRSTFQVFIQGYDHFWNHDDPACDTVSWQYWSAGDATYMTRALRLRMNLLVNGINAKIQKAADRFSEFGVIWVGDISHDYNTHRFCEPGLAEKEKHIDPQIWFWDIQSPERGKANAREFGRLGGIDPRNEILWERIHHTLQVMHIPADSENQEFTEDMLKLEAHPEWDNLTPYEILNTYFGPTAEKLGYDAENLLDGIFCIFHPKLDGHQAAMRWNLDAIKNNGNIIPSVAIAPFGSPINGTVNINSTYHYPSIRKRSALNLIAES